KATLVLGFFCWIRNVAFAAVNMPWDESVEGRVVTSRAGQGPACGRRSFPATDHAPATTPPNQLVSKGT
ncbi:MAG: hypothetical protein QF918_11425, partial [Pirellulaceae bacterium]|nr:hypothetical protein [Pirellulaceae bacterium]